MVERILKRKNISFYVDEYQAIGLVYPFEGKDYIVRDGDVILFRFNV